MTTKARARHERLQQLHLRLWPNRQPGPQRTQDRANEATPEEATLRARGAEAASPTACLAARVKSGACFLESWRGVSAAHARRLLQALCWLSLLIKTVSGCSITSRSFLRTSAYSHDRVAVCTLTALSSQGATYKTLVPQLVWNIAAGFVQGRRVRNAAECQVLRGRTLSRAGIHV